ncbi:uncharacterized protein LOC127265888 [Andrographis paniculata]|uniref:uncharacterized protein LOC127265888 n=1 Tax=Andrographis paniculata TaxID=175694 RepID=UPI0021E996C3|nr:uncharacterized protein LOC127265888 [Andrographis paniculata]
MGRESNDQAVVGSSIVLLQERFKKLQRVKEIQEKRRVLELLPQSMKEGCTDTSTTVNTSFSIPQTSLDNDPLELGLNFNGARFGTIKGQQFSLNAKGNRNFFDKTDVVDTSLHL